MERAVALYKNRFTVNKSGMRVKAPSFASEVALATAYLHNFLMRNRNPEDEDDEFFAYQEEDDVVEDGFVVEGYEAGAAPARALRDRVMTRFHRQNPGWWE